MSNAALEQLVDEVRDLPLTVSDVLAQVITECDNADASVSSLARIMAGDQALAAMVLKLANSAYYGYARRIESLPDAVVLLGFASVKNLAITASITRLLATDQDDLTEIRSGHLRPLAAHRRVCAHPRPHAPRDGREGVRRGPAARPRPDRARLLRQGSLPRAVRARRTSANVPFEDIELEVLGFTSAALGSAVAAEWQFPPGLCDALAHQHDPSAAEADPLLARTVHLADWLAKKLAIGFIGPALRENPDAEAAAEFQLTPASLAALRVRGRDRVRRGPVAARPRQGRIAWLHARATGRDPEGPDPAPSSCYTAAMSTDTTVLYRPVGQAELDLVRESGWAAFPPRFSWQPIFYPVLVEEYAHTIARDWNTKDKASGYAGYVLRFDVDRSFLDAYDVQQVGGRMCREYWIPSAELPAFNDAIVGPIEVIAEYRGDAPPQATPA